MARRRVGLPRGLGSSPQRGIAGRAWDRFIGASPSTPLPLEPRNPSRFTGFGSPGTGRQIRELTVEDQLDVIDRYRQRQEQVLSSKRHATRRERLSRGLNAASRGDDSILMSVDLRAKSSNEDDPKRPRAESAGYDSATGTVRIRFRVGADKSSPQGAIYEYYGVPRHIWKNLLRASSPGRYIDRVLDTYPYTKVDEDWQPTRVFSNIDRRG